MIYNGYSWNDVVLDNFCPLLCAGFEDRCLGFLASLPEDWRAENAILFKYPGMVFPQNEVNRRYILKSLKSHVKNIIEIQITSSYSKQSTKNLYEVLQKIINETNPNIIMDISSMTRGNILSFMSVLSSLSNNSYITYTEPINYDDISNFGSLDLVIVPGFEGMISQEKENFCIFLLGFNVDYVHYVKRKYDISNKESEAFLVGEIDENSHAVRNKWNRIAKEKCEDLGITPIQIPSLNVGYMADLLLHIFSEKGNNYNKIVFPMGPKTYIAAAFLAHRKDSEIQICYPKPVGWSDTNSYGIGMTYIYSLKSIVNFENKNV